MYLTITAQKIQLCLYEPKDAIKRQLKSNKKNTSGQIEIVLVFSLFPLR